MSLQYKSWSCVFIDCGIISEGKRPSEMMGLYCSLKWTVSRKGMFTFWCLTAPIMERRLAGWQIDIHQLSLNSTPINLLKHKLPGSLGSGLTKWTWIFWVYVFYYLPEPHLVLLMGRSPPFYVLFTQRYTLTHTCIQLFVSLFACLLSCHGAPHQWILNGLQGGHTKKAILMFSEEGKLLI